jgi:thiol:disulfide interchange protein DsbC
VRLERLLLPLVLCGALPVLADEAAVRRMVEERLRGGQLEQIRKTPWAGLYEVVVRGDNGPEVFYVDDTASVIISGNVIDAKTGRDHTEERKRDLARVAWGSLPLQWSITTKRGTGRRKIAVFSDPNCPYCKRFEEDLARLDDITIHVLPYAVLGPRSTRHAKAVWCSQDRAKAWNELVLRRVEPGASPDCDNPIDRLAEYGRRIGASATPTWFVETGERHLGALPLEETRQVLDRASPPKPR